eukprot:gb/GECG01003293.1/.p1 GENE.gb/GECG01003293.1/~~gb/GECG01003293.1/.p1  ORF type:complete len:199 (+),score=23.65 gb/GECG01003293.1/:1-597(+)
MAGIPLSKALKEWENQTGESAPDAKEIKILGGLPMEEGKKRVFVSKLDSSVGSLVQCERLSLSTNMIDKMFPLSGMSKLKILSLARNRIKKIEKLDDVAETLEELWLSYNEISSLDGLQNLQNLQVLYLANNQIKDWNELAKLADLPKLREVLFHGNPIYEGLEPTQARISVVKYIPQIVKVDATIITDQERSQAETM